MTVWTWTIKLDGVAVDNVINNVEVTVGSQAALDQPNPAVATVSLLGLPVINGVERLPDWYLGRNVEILVTKTMGGAGARIFYGRVVQQTTTPVDPKATQVITEISAQSYMDKLVDVTLDNDALPAATEYERIYSTYERQLSPSWDEQPTTMSWADIPLFYDADITWAEWEYPDAYYRPLLKVPNWTPGVDPDPSISLEAWTGGPTELLRHSIDLAMGVGGLVTEYFGGISPEIWYLTRADFVTGPTQTINVGSAALSYSLTDTDGIWDVYTEATVSNSTLSASDANFDAMRRFGRMPLDLTSFAALENDLQTIATTKVGALSRPVPYLSLLSVDYAQLAASERIWHTAGNVVTLTGIPKAFGGNDDYFVRGLVFRGSAEQLTVDWVLLNRRAIEPGPMWRNVNAALTWNDLTTSWNDWT